MDQEKSSLAGKTLIRRFRRFLNEAIAKPLVEAGFEREGQKFLKKLGRVEYLVEASREIWSSDQRLYISYQAWLCVKGVEYILVPAKKELRDFPSHCGSLFEMDAAALSDFTENEMADFRFSYLTESDAQVAAKIALYRRTVEQGLLPWFEQFHTPEDVGDFFVDPEPAVGRVRIGYQDPPHHFDDLAVAAACFCIAENVSKAETALGLMRKKADKPKDLQFWRKPRVAAIEQKLAELKARASRRTNGSARR